MVTVGFAIFVGGEWHFEGDHPPGVLERLFSSDGDDEMDDEDGENNGIVLKRTDECATPRCQGREIHLDRSRWVHRDNGFGLCDPIGNPAVKAKPKSTGLPPPTSLFWDAVPP